MGTHGWPRPEESITPPGELQLISLQAWHVMDRTNITAYATYATPTGPKSLNIGAEVLDYRLMDLPTLGQVMWCLGDEVRQAWRELSSPKQ